MNISSIEINDKEFLIKLNREDFDLSLLNQLTKRIQAEYLFMKRLKDDDEEEDIISRKANMDSLSRFDSLDDK